MRCIQFHPAFLPLHTHLTQRQQVLGTHSAKLAAASAPHRQQRLLSLRTKAVQNAITFLGVSPLAKSGGDLQSSNWRGASFGLLVSNFVVPVPVSKNFWFDKVGEEDEDDGDRFNR